MDRQYGHIVYTRCSHPLSVRGTMQKTTGRGGFGIYSLTRDMLDSELDENLASRILNNKRVVSTDLQTVDYVYFVPDIGLPMLGRVRNRTAEEEDEASRQDVDARGCFIGEWLVGELLRYPCEYFDSPFFEADQKPIAAFYGDNTIPLQDPVNGAAIPLGPVTREMALAFAADGRQRALRAIVCELIHQYEQPTSARKFFVIRDTEPNLRLWVAAIEYSLPLVVAKMISFETSVKKIKETTDTGYYVQKATGYTAPDNISDPSLERRSFNMIAGVHPNLLKGLTKDAPSLKNAPYFVIDGESREAWFEADTTVMKRAYIGALFQDDLSIKGFCDSMGQMTGIVFDSSLYDLYDAQMVIQDENSWEYDKLMKAVAILSPHFTDRSVLMLYLMDALCVKNAYLQRFACQDEERGLAMFGMLMEMAERFGLRQMSDEIYNSVNNRFIKLLSNPEAATQMDKLQNCLKARSTTTYYSIISTAINTNKLSMIDPQAMMKSSNGYAYTVISIVDDYLKATRGSWSRFLEEPDYLFFTEALIKKSIGDTRLSSQFIRTMLGDNKAIDYFILHGSKQLSDNSAEYSRWWRIMMANNLPLEHLCKLIADKDGSIDLIEDLLYVSLQQNGCSEKLHSLFNTYLARVPGAGEHFLREWIKLARAHISVNSNYTRLLTETLLSMDHDLVLSEDRDNSELAAMLGNYASRVRGLYCPNVVLWNYLHNMSNARIIHNDRDELAQTYLSCNIGCMCYRAPSDLLNTPLGKAFVQKISECREEIS